MAGEKMRLVDYKVAVLGGISLGVIIGTLAFGLLTLHAIPADMLVALATIVLVYVTALTVLRADTARESSEEIARKQLESSKKIAEDQTYAIKWMKEQETKPYCAIVFVRNTSTATAEGVYFKNLGHGPALEVEWKFNDGDRVYQGKKGLLQLLRNHELLGYMECYLPTMLGASSQEGIFRLVTQPKNAIGITDPNWEEARENLRELLGTLTVIVSFTSIMWQGHRETLTVTAEDAW